MGRHLGTDADADAVAAAAERAARHRAGLPIMGHMHHRLTLPALLLLGLLAGACSPALNWRTVELDGPGLQLLLPCKPERAERTVEWTPGQDVVLVMNGCDAGGTTFAVSYLRLDDPARAPGMLAQWQAAVRARLHAPDAAGAAGATALPPAAAVFVPRGALPLPESVRLLLQGRGPDGAAVLAEAAWFARQEGAQAWLFHAMVYNAAAAPREAASTFFEGLRLR